MTRRLAFLFVFVALSLWWASCGPLPRGGRGGGGSAGFTSACRADFGASAAASEFEAFMAATYEFHQAADEAQQSLLVACQTMGQRLEMPAAELQGEGGPEGTRAVCQAVVAKIRSEMDAVRAETANTTFEVRATPPRCEARFDAYASCAAECDVNIQPGQLEIQCEGGEIRGGCSGQCSGSCAVDVNARCTGTCEGSCDGTCSATAADGTCAGRCDGTCSGRCVAEASAQCTGECRGSCSVEWERPYCTTDYEPPQVDAECRAACEARVEASMECTPGSTELVVTNPPSGETLARIERLRAAVAAGLAQVHVVRARMERLRDSGGDVLRHVQRLPNTVQAVGISAAACAAAAGADLTQSMSSASVTLDVSVSVSASFSATAG
jgi:hypothetical protein